MKKYLVVLAALSLILSGCGKNEEEKLEKAESAPEAMESKPAEESMAEAPAMAEEAAPAASEESGGAMMEEAASAAEEAMAAAEATAPAPMAEAPSGEADMGMGKQAYDQICFACHAQGVAGAPKIGDKAAWEPRIAKGMDTLVMHAIDGFQGTSGVMPPKGGLPSLSDEQVKAAVAYMVEQSK